MHTRPVTTESPFVKWLLVGLAAVILTLFLLLPLAAVFVEAFRRGGQVFASALREEAALHANQFNPYGFEWVDLNHRAESGIVFKRKGKNAEDDLLIVLNMTPVVRNDWEITVKGKAYSRELFNSDAAIFWGTGKVFNPEIRSEKITVGEDEEAYRIRLNIPPLAGLILK